MNARRKISELQRAMIGNIANHQLAPVHAASKHTLFSLIRYGFVVYCERNGSREGHARYGLTIQGVHALKKIEQGDDVWIYG